MDPEELRQLFAEAREARGQIPDARLNELIIQHTNGQARNMTSLAQLVGEQSEQVTAAEAPSLGKFPGTVQAFGQGASFNTLDDIVGLISPEEGASVRQQATQFGKEHPVLSIGGEIGGALAGGLLGGVGAARAIPGIANAATRTLSRRLLSGAVGGAAGGAASEAGRAESGDRAAGAKAGGLFGAAGGLFGAGILAPALGAVGSAILRRLPASIKRRATRLVGNVVEESGGGTEAMNKKLAQANRVGGETADEVRVFDLVGDELGDVAGDDVKALQAATSIIESRSQRAPARIRQQGDFALGVEDTASELRQLTSQQRAATRQAYDALSDEDKLFPIAAMGDKVTVPSTPVAGPADILDFQGFAVPSGTVPGPVTIRPPVQKAIRTAAADRAGRGLPPLPDGQLDFDAMQSVKLALDDQVSRAYRKGTPGKARGLRVVRDDFVEAMNNVFEDFAPTQSLFAGSRQLDDAISQGQRIASKSIAEIEADLAAIGEDAVLMRGYRAGASEAISEATSRQTNPVRIFNEGLRNKIDLIAPEGADLNRLTAALDLEAQLARAKVPDNVARSPAAIRKIADRPLARAIDPSGANRPGTGGQMSRGIGLIGGINQQGGLAPSAAATSARQATTRAQVGLLGERLTPGAVTRQAAGRQQGILDNLLGRTILPGTVGERIANRQGIRDLRN